MIHYYRDILKYWIPSCLAIVVTFLTSSTSSAQDVPSNLEWKKICDGIEHTNFKIEEPLLNVNVLRIDATNPKLTFHTTPRNANWVANVNETDRRTLPDSVVEENMIVAVNANFYSPFNAQTRVSRGPADNQGLVVSNGILVSPTINTYPSFIQNKDGSVEIRIVLQGESLDKIKTAVSGRNYVLKDGECVSKEQAESFAYLKNRHPRTVVGISQDKKYVYLVTIDGRQPEFSVGTSMLESGKILLQLGAYDAVNLDGGGSTTMAYRDESGKPVVLNRPVGLGPANTLRHNANALGVKLSGNK
ncbi:MAG: phosphodiester glycosidase family protein [Thermoguttaceae bacterium]|nr:phosphodiester glycosidase family protein [Thermoguttaceae bacterium]